MEFECGSTLKLKKPSNMFDADWRFYIFGVENDGNTRIYSFVWRDSEQLVYTKTSAQMQELFEISEDS